MYFVYYENGFFEDGGVGFERFATKEEALDFINDRTVGVLDPTNYTLIQGRAISLRAQEVVTKIFDEG